MKIIKNILAITSIVLLFVLLNLSFELLKVGKEAKVYKSDYSELHSAQYGMFNSVLWTSKITKIVENKIDNFDINLNNRKEIEGYVSMIIDTLIVEAERIVKERNKGGKGFFGSLMGTTKQMIVDSVVDFKSLRKRVPEFSNIVMVEIEKDENQQRVKKMLKKKLKEFMKGQAQSTTDMTLYNAVLEKYKVNNIEECTLILDNKISENRKIMEKSMFQMLSIALMIIVLVTLQGRLNSIGLLALSGTTLSLLVTGVMLPMLDIEAKISKLYFMMLEQPIVFENQILFFQSKSIYDLLTLLLESGKEKMIFVGMLLVLFSMIFPFLKLMFTSIYFYSKGFWANASLTRFFALYSTKWSMADVMVVSIFMAYLGLDGVVDNELQKLETQSGHVNVITFNGTHLEVGFFLFLGFVLTSFVLSILVERSKKETSS